MPITQPREERFWNLVEVRSEDECWPWKGSHINSGYGRFRLSRSEGSMLSHRYSYSVTNGPIPEGMNVLHRCDNRTCCNPQHLFLGTQSDNLLDASRKGRLPGAGSRARARLRGANGRFVRKE